jgi:hypothetical protein
MRLPMLAITLLVGAGLVAGCGSDDESSTPTACLGGADAYLEALRGAPGPVRLDDSVPLGDCLTSGQGAGDLAQIGGTSLAVATRLNDDARRDPAGPAPVELGYLVGAFEQAGKDTAGIHADLVRRIETAARYAPGSSALPAEFRRGYEEGFRAAQRAR